MPSLAVNDLVPLIQKTKDFEPLGETKTKENATVFKRKSGPDLHSSAAPMNLATEDAIESGKLL